MKNYGSCAPHKHYLDCCDRPERYKLGIELLVPIPLSRTDDRRWHILKQDSAMSAAQRHCRVHAVLSGKMSNLRLSLGACLKM